MAYAAFADAPVDAAVVEVGMGGAWDATNVVDAKVAVLTPIAVDHAQYLGDDARDDRPGEGRHHQAGRHVVVAEQSPEVAEVLVERAAEVGATLAREGLEFGVVSRVAGGRRPDDRRCRGSARQYDEMFLPLYGAHQAQNAALALAAVEAFAGGEAAGRRAGRGGVRRGDLARAASRSSAAARRSCSTPPTTRTAPRRPSRRSQDSFTFSPLIGVVGVMADKDDEGLLAEFEPVLAHDRVHPELHRRGRCRPSELGRGRPRTSSARTGSASRLGSTTRSTRPSTLAEDRRRPSARRSAPAACSSRARSSRSARRARCCAAAER